jgi:replication factor C subunit 3/5
MAALWCDKTRPLTLSKLTLHQDITIKLKALAKSEELPHLLVYGPPGAGKKTRVMSLLREIYGPGVEKVKLEHRAFKTPTQKLIDITTIGSNYHIECNPSDAGSADRFVIQEVIKEIASHGSLTKGKDGSKSFKIVILTEVDRLSKQAQAGLRRTMEKYSSQCRIILICNSPSKIIEPVRSRCLSIRIPSPSTAEIADLLVATAKKEQVTVPLELGVKMATMCDRNLRRALLMCEASKVQYGANILPVELIPQLPDWEIYIIKLARELLQEQSPAKLLIARDMMYELLTNCIPGDVIMQTLCRELMKVLDDSLKHEISYWAAYYEHRMKMGSKDIFHLEAFVAKFLAVYKRWLISMFS